MELKKWISNLLILVLRLPQNRLKDRIRDYFYGDVVSERIIEYGLVFLNLNKFPSRKIRVLDIGCYYSNFPLQLASMGYLVFAVDLMNYQLNHPNLKFIKGDILKVKFRKNYFDIITSISTLEHMGLGFYKGDVKENRKDLKAVELIKSLLKKEGRFIFTVPYGKKQLSPIQKVYNSRDINKMLKGWRVVEKLYFREIKGKWFPASEKEASKVDSATKTKAILFAVLSKK